MPQLATDLIELAVGMVCLGVMAAAWRRGLRVVAVVFAAAGVAAVAHAAWSVAT
jgi:hypothetical protein